MQCSPPKARELRGWLCWPSSKVAAWGCGWVHVLAGGCRGPGAGPSSKVTVCMYVLGLPPISGQEVMPCRESQADGIRNLPPLAQTWTTFLNVGSARGACGVFGTVPSLPRPPHLAQPCVARSPWGFPRCTTVQDHASAKSGAGTVYLRPMTDPRVLHLGGQGVGGRGTSAHTRAGTSQFSRYLYAARPALFPTPKS